MHKVRWGTFAAYLWICCGGIVEGVDKVNGAFHTNHQKDDGSSLSL
jgi:hypothetical protein